MKNDVKDLFKEPNTKRLYEELLYYMFEDIIETGGIDKEWSNTTAVITRAAEAQLEEKINVEGLNTREKKIS